MRGAAVPQAGEVLLHYELIEPLGAGGGGVVWRARDERLGRDVALKLLPDRLLADTAALSRFEAEARTVAALAHPNIVTIYAIERAGDVPFLTMELVRGTTLDRLIPAGGLPADRTLALALPLADAVAAAHERGIVHGDLKPRNVMVDHDGHLKVLDFGLAQARPTQPADDVSDTRTRGRDTGRLAGTFPYMSPEQVQGAPLDARSDIFSLGVILYELATGRRPFVGGTPAEVIAAILRDPVPSPAALRAGLPVRLARTIERCLEKDARRRMQSCADLRDELREVEREGEGAVRSFGPSVAVLPFVDMSRERDQEYFCEGMAEEIITALAGIGGLRVASRTSSFLYGGTALDSREIGRRLQVATLLEGSVRKLDEQVRVAAQLIDTATGYHLWTERYDRSLKDVFAIQEEIAASIARALKIALTSARPGPAAQPPTTDLEAYDCYLRGRKAYFAYDRAGVAQGLAMFSRAIGIDPDYARAHAGIAYCSAFLYMMAGRHATDLDRADEASARALQLDPALAEAHAARGVALSLRGLDRQADASFEAAMRLDPALFDAPYFYARHCFAGGRTAEAVALYEQAAAVEPQDYQALLLVAQVYDDMSRGEDAAAARRRGIERAEARLRLDPSDARARYMGANALVALGERDRGLDWARMARALQPDDTMVLYNLGCIYAMAGEAHQALDCLEHAVRGGFTYVAWFLHDSNLDALRAEPRFQALLATLGAALPTTG